VAEVRFEDVKKSFGKVTVIEHLDLTIGSGKFVVLVGPSGCGKSTTLRMIAGLEEITEGELYIDDRVVNKVPPKDRDIAMVFQSYALYPHMTIYKNLAFGLLLRKTPKAEIDKRVRTVAELLGLDPFLDRLPKQLSGGQRQRVAMGRAIVREPRVFLFDEPLSNLDAKLRAQMRREIARLHREKGTTIVYVTHDQVEAMTLADVIVVMHQGRIMQQGSPLHLYDRPVNRFVAEFIGSPQMNILEVEAKDAGGDLTLKGEGFGLAAPADFDVKAGQPVLVGIRPADVRVLDPEEDDALVTCVGEVEVHEPMGAEAMSTVVTKLGTLTVREEGHGSAAIGDTVRLAFPGDRVHLFDGETEESLRKENA
jgi:multiple sugar transport system ATP-binding protein